MKFVELQYVGKKESLMLTMPQLLAGYTFNADNGYVEPVTYDDAAYLLKTNEKIFRVVGKPFDTPEHDDSPVESIVMVADYPGMDKAPGIDNQPPDPTPNVTPAPPEAKSVQAKVIPRKGKK